MATCYLEFYDVTGSQDYLDKAVMMARAAKQIYLVPSGDRWEPWAYWQPVYPGDYRESGDPVHWVGPHPNRPSYATAEVSMMAQFHKRGLVFTDEDMQRFVRLHLDVMWNKDARSPKLEYRMPGRASPYPFSLWSALAYVDPTIAGMAVGEGLRARLDAMNDWNLIRGVPGYVLQRRDGDR